MNSLKLYLVGHLIHLLPETRLFSLKNTLLRWAGVSIGNNVRICSSIYIIGNGKLSIGDNTWIGPNCFISSSSKIVIGNNCDIAPCCRLMTGSHEIDLEGGRIAGKGYNADIIVGDSTWVCTGSTILGGSTIGKYSLIAAGSITKGSYTDKKLLKGILAKEFPLKQ